MNIFALRLTALLALSVASATLAATTHYVDLNSPNATPPFTDWTTAATNIQDAIDAATDGDWVVVTNGVYATGGRSWFGSGTNRVTLTNSITLQSVNGPGVTLIVGTLVSGAGPALTNAARCVAIGNTAVLSGFTLTQGEAGTGNYPNGGGVAGVGSIAAAGVVTNCVVTGNVSTNGAGGGAYRVVLVDCLIAGNYANSGGGACACTLLNCSVVSNTASAGGGVYGSTTLGTSVLSHCSLTGNLATGNGGGANGANLDRCILSGNSAQFGGGIYAGVANNCLMVSNAAITASARGGGAYAANLTNCTIVANSSGVQGGGVDESRTLQNCIIYYNSAPLAPNINGGGIFTNCCTTPLPTSGRGNFTNLPLLVNLDAGDYHLSSNSPCINSGYNVFVSDATDLDGNPRVAGGTVDLGAYEFPSPASVLSYAWAQQFGLPTDGSADFADADGDGLNNWQEWIAGTNPTNAASVLALQAPATNAIGLSVSWQSVNTRRYFLQRATNLPAFFAIKSNLVGQVGTTTYLDTTATNGGPYFYRVGVQ